MKRFHRELLVVHVLLFTAMSATQTVAADAKPFDDRLSGDWGGARTTMANQGVTFDLDSTNYYQGLLSGTGDHKFDDAGRLDAYLNFDSKKLGLWDGGLLRTHTEYRYGSLSPTLGGVVAPTNLGARLPEEKDTVVVTSLNLVQKVNDKINVIIGKINTVDLLASDPFFGGAGYMRFFNLAFAAPPNGVLPPVIMGAIASVNTSPISWTFMVYDPNDRTMDYFPDDLFHDGVNVSVSGKYSAQISGRSSSIAVTGIYSTKDGANLGELLLPSDLKTGDKSASWHASVQLAHFLHESATQPGNGWGVFVKLGASDGNPNPYQGFITGGVGGKGLFASRPNDTFGLGYFYYNLSDALQSSITPLVEFDDETGVEAYYNYAITPWAIVAADLQYVNPAAGGNDNALVGGVRLRIRF